MLRNIYLKEIKDSFRDRRTLILTVFLPIFMMSGLLFFYEGMASDHSDTTYVLAVEEGVSEEILSLVSGLENIEVVKDPDPVLAVEEGEAHTGIMVSSDFIDKVSKGEEAVITLVGDSFSQNSSNLMNLVTSALTTYEKTIVTERLEARDIGVQVIQPFEIETVEISDEGAGVMLLALLIPLLLAISIGVGAGAPAADLFAGEKERKTMEALLMTPVSRSTLVLAKWLCISTIGCITGFVTLIVLFAEVYFFTENLAEAFKYEGMTTIMMILVSLLLTIMYSFFIASLLTLTSILGKTVKEAQSFSTPILLLAAFPGMLIANIGVSELNTEHFAIPILNLFSQIKELLFGVINLEHILITLGSNLLFLTVIFIISRLLFMKDKWVMN